MKKIFAFCIAIFTTSIAFAQVPSLMNYQAVARNAQGQALANQNIKVRLTLTENNANSSLTFYSETRSVTTNALGLFNVQIGSAGAQNVLGGINNTNWTDNTKTRNLNVEIDPANNGSFVNMGSQQLVSVPYAFAAESARRISAPFIGFRAEKITNYTIPTLSSGQVHTLRFETELYDSSNVYNPTTYEFTVPESGMYFLSTEVLVNIASLAGTNEVTISFRSLSTGSLESDGDGNSYTLRQGKNTISRTLITYLTQGDKIFIGLKPVVKTTEWAIPNYGNNFQAYKIK